MSAHVNIAKIAPFRRWNIISTHPTPQKLSPQYPITQNTVTRDGQEVELRGKGRHDPCVLPRAVPIVEAMAALVLADFYLINKIYQ